MASSNSICLPSAMEEEEREWRERCQELLQTLPQQNHYRGFSLHLYQGFWYPRQVLKGLLFFQKYLKPHKTDIILASSPKSGTTWLKNLIFTVVNRSKYSLNDTPLLTTNQHQLVPFFEFGLLSEDGLQFPDLDLCPNPRILATHAAYVSLPNSIKDNSDNKVVYICRNPLDQFTSLWHFMESHQTFAAKTSLEVDFDKLCQGISGFGPFWEHILGYWKASLERPDKVLFLKYEDLKEDNIFYVKKIASFLGFPFSDEEEAQGLIQDISKFCSFESLKDLQVNKTGKTQNGMPHSAFYRKGKTGDWVNYLGPAMADKMEKLIQEKFRDSNLSFSLYRET